jgi:NSS family neurotransmitter:Na+ symporter
MSLDPAEGPGLVFVVLPKIFALIPGGRLVGATFFLLLSIAALTSTISLLEVATAYLVDEKRTRRRTAVWIVAVVSLILGVPSLLSQGMVPWLGELPVVKMSFLGLMDWIFGNFSLAVGAFFISIFFAWVWKLRRASPEIFEGYPGAGWFIPVLDVMLRFFCPACILILMIMLVKQLF